MNARSTQLRPGAGAAPAVRLAAPVAASVVASIVAIGLLAAAASCSSCSSSGQSDESLGDLVIARDDRPAAIDVDRAARDADELLRAAAMPHAQIGALLGAHRFRGKSTAVVREGDATLESLEVDSTIDLAADGAFHAVSNNSADYGREVYFAGGVLYLRPRYGRFHRRAPAADGEPARVRDEIAGDLGAYLALLAPGIEVTDDGTEEVAGRTGRRIRIAKAPRPRPRASQPAHRAWRESAQVVSAEGQVVLDAETGAPLRAEIRGELQAISEGRTLTLTLSVTHAISDLGAAIEIAPPPAEETVATPERSREVAERDQLLQGLAPPTRRELTAPGDPTPARPAPGSGDATESSQGAGDDKQ